MMFSDVVVGDKVWSLEFGWGIVIETNTILDGGDTGVSVKFYDCVEQYMEDGRRMATAYQTLFWKEICINLTSSPIKKLQYIPVIVSDDGETLVLSSARHSTEADAFQDIQNCKRAVGIATVRI